MHFSDWFPTQPAEARAAYGTNDLITRPIQCLLNGRTAGRAILRSHRSLQLLRDAFRFPGTHHFKFRTRHSGMPRLLTLIAVLREALLLSADKMAPLLVPFGTRVYAGVRAVGCEAVTNVWLLGSQELPQGEAEVLFIVFHIQDLSYLWLRDSGCTVKALQLHPGFCDIGFEHLPHALHAELVATLRELGEFLDGLVQIADFTERVTRAHISTVVL